MIYEVNSNDPKEGILMSDKNNSVMMNNDMNNNMNNDNDPKQQVLLFVQYLPADLQQAPLKESIHWPDGTVAQ